MNHHPSFKSILALFLTLCFLVSGIPFSASADEAVQAPNLEDSLENIKNY
jgi:hypothetical protein